MTTSWQLPRLQGSYGETLQWSLSIIDGYGVVVKSSITMYCCFNVSILSCRHSTIENIKHHRLLLLLFVWLLGNTLLRQVLDGEYPKLVRLYSELWRRVQSLGGAAAAAPPSISNIDQTNVTTELDSSSMSSLLTVDNSSASLSLDDNDYELV